MRKVILEAVENTEALASIEYSFKAPVWGTDCFMQQRQSFSRIICSKTR